MKEIIKKLTFRIPPIFSSSYRDSKPSYQMNILPCRRGEREKETQRQWSYWDGVHRSESAEASFLSQMARASTRMPQNDDVWLYRGTGGGSLEEFSVEDLLNLDFSDEEFLEQGPDKDKGAADNSSTAFSGADDFDGLADAVEVGGLESLELVEETTVVELSLLCPAPSFTTNAGVFHTSVPRKRRSKRRRSNAPPWPFVKPEAESRPICVRRCAHCHVQKTPQWRTGPLGPKTLCNACGVRFKSGRLLPEYRPACSPTFTRRVHSNSHRRVLEMRRVKEIAAAEDYGGSLSPVQIIGTF